MSTLIVIIVIILVAYFIAFAIIGCQLQNNSGKLLLAFSIIGIICSFGLFYTTYTCNQYNTNALAGLCVFLVILVILYYLTVSYDDDDRDPTNDFLGLPVTQTLHETYFEQKYVPIP